MTSFLKFSLHSMNNIILRWREGSKDTIERCFFINPLVTGVNYEVFLWNFCEPLIIIGLGKNILKFFILFISKFGLSLYFDYII